MAPRLDAAPSAILAYQGRLTDPAGAILVGNYFVRFSIYTDDTVGAPDLKLWPTGTPSAMPVTVTNGVFNVGIGDTAGNGDALTLDFESNSAYYLQVEVSSNGSTFETLTPRQRLDVASYAVNADTVDGAHAGTSANNVLELGNSGEISISGFISTLSRLILGSSLGAGGGTALLVNTAAPFDGTLLNLQVNGSSRVSVASSGLLTATNGLTVSGGSVSFPAGSITDSAIASALTGKTYNGLSLTSAADGFTIAGGTTSRTLTVSGADVSLNQNLLTTSSPTFTAINAKTIQSTSNDLRISGASGQGITVLTDGVSDAAYIAGDIRDSQNNPYAPETKATVAGAYWFDARYGIRTNATDSVAKNVYLSGQNQRLNNATNLSGGDVLIHGGLGASGSAGAAHGGNVKIDGGQAFGTGHAGHVLIGTEQASDVGIGTSDPLEKLHVAGQGSDVAVAILSGADATNGSLKVGELANSLGYLNYDGTDNRWEFGTEYNSAATEAFYIVRGSQTVFFNGTVDVTTTLNVRQSLYAGAGTIDAGVSNMINNFQNNTGLLIKPTAAGTGTRVSVVDENGDSEFIVKDGGNVGIGTADPAEKLTVAGNVSATGTATFQHLYLTQGALNGSNLIAPTTTDGADQESIKIGGGGLPGQPSRGPSLELYGNEVSGFNLYGDAVIRLGDGDGATYKGDFRIFGSSDLFVVKNDGSVGIGDTSPSSKLVVNSASFFSPSLTFNSAAHFNLKTGGGELVGGEQAGSPYGFWLQSRSWASTAFPLMLNPLGGNVGIGTTSPTGTLHVSSEVPQIIVDNPTGGASELARLQFSKNGTAKWYLDARNGNEGLGDDLWIADTSNNYFVFDDGTGRFGIGTTGPSDKLHVSGGEIRTNSCVKNSGGTAIAGTCSSDERLKQNIRSLDVSLDDIVALDPVTYEWRADEYPEFSFGSGTNIGLVAQQVEGHIPELVAEGEHGFKAVKFQELPFYLLQGLKELRLEVQELATQTTAATATGFTGLLDWLRDKSISVAGLTVGSNDRPSGVTTYDRSTGEPYCLAVDNGQPTITPGVCP
ncbi:tail fiber domain-containing protein [Candidatus Binatia bacterium]|nr:tail fiber domain-containing protein [Candidatus Binatia bacterium]